jgi:hypothetical protein
VKSHFWILFAILFVIHHDFWWWDDPSLILGFLPIGMAWHVLFSIAASVFWLAVIKYSWPSSLESWAEQKSSQE